MTVDLEDGYRRARAVTRAHAKSFYFSSFVLFGARRRAAFAIYTFCRRLDDLVDAEAHLERQALSSHLAALRSELHALFSRPEAPSAAPDPWHPAEWAAFADTVHRYHIPEAPFQDLISGMEMDLVKSRYANFAELDLYCYRVAGTVGLMLLPVLGYRDPRAARPAADLGRAMQLTNILRDVKEDGARGRCYLPEDELRTFGLTAEDVARGGLDERLVALMRFQVARARRYYERATEGIPLLEGRSARTLVRVMSAVYGAILGSIERQGFDVFQRRAYVPLPRKLALAARVLLQGDPAPAPPALVGFQDGGDPEPGPLFRADVLTGSRVERGVEDPVT